MKEDQFWNFAEGEFPSIEIDVEYFKSLSPQDKVKYLVRLIFQEKDLGNRLNMLNWIIGNGSKIARVFIKNKQFQEYMKLLENGTKMIGVATAAGNIIKAKQTYKHTKNNEIAKLMGFPNGNYVNYTKMDVTQAMLDAFLEMSDFHKDKYKIRIDQILKNDTGEKGLKSTPENSSEIASVQKMMITGHLEDEKNKFGLVVNSLHNTLDEDTETTNVSGAKLFYPITGTTLTSDELKEKMEQIMFQLYVDKVDTRRNYIRVNGSKLEICPREEIIEQIRNINTEKLRKSMDKTLSEGRRRGIVLVGEPGTGKTITTHKLVNYFPNNLVFWVKPDSISTTMGIRSTFKIFEMFKNSIMVFDDLDSAPLTSKNEVTNEFLAKLDGTSKLTGFIIATVNDPSKLHAALINRPERFDEVIEVKTPQSYTEIAEILTCKANEAGYYTKEQIDDGDTNGDVKGEIKVDLFALEGASDTNDVATTKKGKGKTKKANENGGLKQIYDEIIAAKLTQVQVAGLIGTCHEYDGEISISSLREAYNTSISSMNCANLVAKKGRLIKSDDISEDAKATLYHNR